MSGLTQDSLLGLEESSGETVPTTLFLLIFQSGNKTCCSLQDGCSASSLLLLYTYTPQWQDMGGGSALCSSCGKGVSADLC